MLCDHGHELFASRFQNLFAADFEWFWDYLLAGHQPLVALNDDLTARF